MDRVALYCTNPEFVAWLLHHNYSRLTDDSIATYYMLFEHETRCAAKTCQDCAGVHLSAQSEDDIHACNIVHARCYERKYQSEAIALKVYAERLQVPPAFVNADISGLQILPSAVQALNAYHTQFVNSPKQPGLYIYASKPGTGRSTSLWYVAQQLLNRSAIQTCLIKTSLELIDDLHKEIRDDDHSIYRFAQTCDLLGVDDIGLEKHTPWSRDRILSILEYRNTRLKPTLCTSVLAPQVDAWPDGADSYIITKLLKNTQVVHLDTENY